MEKESERDRSRGMTNEEIEQLYQDGVRDGEEMAYREMLAFLKGKVHKLRQLEEAADELSRLKDPDTTGR